MTAVLPRVTFAVNESNPACAALRDGEVRIAGFEVERASGANIIGVFREMCRTMCYDVSEMAVVTYFLARRYGLPMTAIPVFPQMGLPIGSGIFFNQRSGIRTVKDLEGKRVGLRAYSVTPHTWQRAYLESRGVDCAKITWVSADEDHVAQFNSDGPANIEYRVGANLRELLENGEIDAAMAARFPADGDIGQLDPEAEIEWTQGLERQGIHHAIHLVVIKDEALRPNPRLAAAAVDAFRASKQKWLDSPDKVAPARGGGDPLPIGLGPLRKSLEVLMSCAVRDGILPAPLDLDEIFLPGFE